MRTVLAVLAVLVFLPAPACGPTAEQQAELARLKEENQSLGERVKVLESENEGLAGEARRLQAEVQRLRKREVLMRLGIEEGQSLVARLETSMGTIHCALFPEASPQTVLNFVELAEGTREWTDPLTGRAVRRPLYDGTIFHRVIPGFMIQGGDPLGNGTGGPGYRFADETNNGLVFDGTPLLAMANSGPNTNGSQFFITDRSTPSHLDGKHTIFGRCENADVVQAIAEVERGARDKPVKDVRLERVRIIRGG